jgi:hypothetical protein
MASLAAADIKTILEISCVGEEAKVQSKLFSSLKNAHMMPTGQEEEEKELLLPFWAKVQSFPAAIAFQG